MPFRPEHSLITLEDGVLHTIDTSSVESLHGMWSILSKTSHAMEHGKRLENFSWRLWTREAFCCNPESRSRSTSRISIPSKPKAAATDIPMPALSSSLDSAISEESDDESTSSSPTLATTIPKARPELRCADACLSRSRGNEKHISPDDLEKLVLSIKETQPLEPIDVPMPAPSFKSEDIHTIPISQDLTSFQSYLTPATEPSSDTTPNPSSLTASRGTLLESSASTVDTNDDQTSQTVGSESSSHTEASTHSIIRGFVAGGAPSSYRSQTNLAAQPTPILKSSSQYSTSRPKKKGAMFTIGTSSGEDESSLESHMYKSSLSDGLRRPNGDNKKQTSFKEEVAVGRAAEHSPVFESDDEDEEVSESAIEDDDDSSDWEDSDDQSGPSSVNEKELFQRVDSRPNLTSRRSLLTTQLHETDRAKALANEASRSVPALRRARTSPNGPSVPTSPTTAQAPTMYQHPSGTKPIIMTTSNALPVQQQGQLAHSPRTTRRNMLSTELTESLRKNLLWERQHRSTGNLAALKRRHTSNDVKNLKQQPEPGPTFSHHAKGFTNDYFHAGLSEFHTKGW